MHQRQCPDAAGQQGEYWFRRQELQASTKLEYLGPGMLARAKYTRCDGHFYLHKKEPKGRKNKRSRCGIARPSQIEACCIPPFQKTRTK